MTDQIDFGDEPWKAIPRSTLRDERLSPKAKGGLVTLLSHDEGWVRSCIGILRRECRCGREQAQAIMAELRALGYADLLTDQNEDGSIHTRYFVRAIATMPQVEREEWDNAVIRVDRNATSSDPGSDGFPVGGEPVGREPRSAGSPATEVEPLEVEPLEVEPTTETLAPKSARERDPIFEVLFTLDSGNPYSEDSRAQFTKTALGAVNQAAGQIRATGCSPGS